MKKIKCFLLSLIILLILFPVNVFANENEDTDDTKEKTINIAVSFDNQIATERIVYQAFKRMGYNAIFETSGMTTAIVSADSGEQDGLLVQGPGLEEKYENLVMVNSYVTKVYFEVFAKTDKTYSMDKWDDLSGLRVGTLYQKYHIENNLPSNIKEHIKYDNWPQLLEALKNGECDVAVMTRTIEEELVIPESIKKVGIVDYTYSCPYLNKKYEYLVPELEKTINEMKEDGTYDAIYNGSYMQHGDNKNVLLITSYSSESLWERTIVENIKSTLEVDNTLTISTIALNGRRILDASQRDKIAIKTIRAILHNVDFDAIIVSDKYAFDFVQSNYQYLFNSKPIFFCGIENIEEGNITTISKDKITGVYEYIPIKETLNEMLELFPNTERIYVINDYTEVGLIWKESIEEQSINFVDKVEFIYNENISADELLEDLSDLPPNSLILTGMYYIDGYNSYTDLSVFYSQMNQIVDTPVFGLFGTSHGYGHIGGCYDLPNYQGKTVANMVLEYFNNKDISSITYDYNTNSGVWMFDYEEMTKWGIKRKDLPENSIITNVPPSFKDTNPTAYYFTITSIIVALITIVGSIIFLKAVGKRNKKIYQKEQQIRYTQGEFKKIIDIVPIAIVLFNPHTGKIIYSNSASGQMFGFSNKRNMVGINIKKLHMQFKMDDKEEESTINENIDLIMASDETRLFEMVACTSEGKYFDVAIRANHVVYNEETCIVAAYIDTSQEVERNQMLQNAANEEKEANKLKSRFLMNMSHEIRTPMNAVIGLSDLALRRFKGEKSYDSFRKINKSANYLLQIINDILDFSKIEAEKLDLIEEEFSLEDIVSNALLIAEEKIGEKPIELSAIIEKDVPCKFIGDKSRIWQILKNILDNAAKYTMEGFISLYIKVKEDTDTNATIIFEISDSGMGMTKKQIEKIYTPFEQFHDEGKTFGEGTGLGMTITRQLISLMGAELVIDSEVNVGTTFTIEITLPKTDSCRSLEKELATYGASKNQEVLLVQNQSKSREYTDKILNLIGYSTVCISSIEEMQDIISKYKEFYSIILDHSIYKENKDVIKWIVDNGKYTNLILSVSQLEEVEEDNVKILQRPFMPSELARILLNDEDRESEVENYKEFSNARVLVCEDNELNQEVVTGVMNIFGVNPIIASNGKESIDKLEQSEFDMVFMDIMMPVMDGHEATKVIRNSNKTYSNVPIIAMTAHVMKEELDKCIESGMNGYIKKPLDINEIYNVLYRFLL